MKKIIKSAQQIFNDFMVGQLRSPNVTMPANVPMNRKQRRVAASLKRKRIVAARRKKYEKRG